ncbi:DHA2 family efflux MFS transporter permease subunit [Lolliginicoccus levis]|uniref:DHA2 family efflux MFS transporter permease subunit n=1 Tax=Lolliginicoccus levis TaxID=2919542 RepID=UPI00241E278A|nr:DHA2 family efflux MFS transporter permease subunit [Lolliginicoccus levis]
MTTGTAPGVAADSDRIPWQVWRLAGVIVLGAFASGLDTSLVHVALEEIRSDLDSSLRVAQWVASGYLLALAVSLPLAGWLGDRYGVGRVWLFALAGFTVTSVLCAMSVSIEMLIAMRALQGLCGGVLIPAGQTVLGRAVGAEKVGRVIATLGIAVTLAPALGPVLGGVLLHTTSWPWLFAINLPIGVIGLALGLRYVPRGEAQRGRTLDLPGLALLSVGLPSGLYGLTESVGGDGVDPVAAGALVLGVVLLASYVRHAGRVPEPVLRLGLFAQPRFAASVAAACFTGMLMFGVGLVIPLYFQLLHGDGTIETGLRLLSLGGGTALALPWCGRLVDRKGAGPVAVVGTAACLVGSLALVAVPASLGDTWVMLLVLFVLGVALAFGAVPPTIAAYKSVSAQNLSQATTQVNIVQRLGGALGGAVFTVILARWMVDDVETGFRAVFVSVAVVSLLAVLAALRLRSVERREAIPSPGLPG